MAGAPTGPMPGEQASPEMGAPEMAPQESGMPGMEAGPGPLDEEMMRAEIERDFSNIKGKAAELNTRKYISRNKIKQAKMELMKQVFDIMIGMGVDPNNLDSINNFLGRLEKEDPDLVELFELVINGMSPDEPEQQPQDNSGLMAGVAGNQQENILRQ